MPVLFILAWLGEVSVSAVNYVGRFAPSPTGELHIGSLLAATASYLEAHAHGGRWLLRMENLDPPREPAGAAQGIIDTLMRFGFRWDGELVWQHTRHDAYEAALQQLARAGLAYACGCSRSAIKAAGLRAVDGWRYAGWCRERQLAWQPGMAWRLRVSDGVTGFTDALQGVQQQELAREVGDFVLRRADGLWAYQLAVVVDDAAAGVTHVVRGADLLDSTPRQIHLAQALGYAAPQYLHLPVLANQAGEKLSKQTLAPALQAGMELPLLWFVLDCLGQNPPPCQEFASLEVLWSWARQHWSVGKIPHSKAIQVEPLGAIGYRIL